MKTLIKRRFEKKKKKKEVEKTLVKYEENQGSEEELKAALIKTEADKDEEIIQAAQRLMTRVQPQQAGMGKFNVQFTGNVQGVVQGDHANVTMNFGDKPSKE